MLNPVEILPSPAPRLRPPVAAPASPPLAAVVLVLVVIFACAAWSQAAYAVVDPADFVYFPPFEAGQNANATDHLGGEYFNIARSLVRGQGFSNPFHEPTGPTAWMPPLLPAFYAVVLRLGGKDAVIAAGALMQVAALAFTGVIVITLAAQSAGRRGGWIAALSFLVATVWDFHAWFQFTHDYGLVLVAVDLLIVGLISSNPPAGRWAAVGWGVFGGVCALVNPIVGGVWLLLTAASAARRRARVPLVIAVVAGAAVLVPWIARNYIVFGRLIPVKSNVGYELFQSQCLQEDGLMRSTILETHPYSTNGPERQEYVALGEIAFLDRSTAKFWESVKADPLDFCDRVAYRLLGATVWYVPVHRDDVWKKPWSTTLYRLFFPLPFLSLLVIVFTAWSRPPSRVELVVAGTYVLYLLPYIAISYYDRYGLPLIGIKTLLVVFGIERLGSPYYALPLNDVTPSAEE
jgi:hypothetical protein